MNISLDLLEKLKYPIGKFTAPDHYSPELIKSYIEVIEAFPSKIAMEVLGLSDSQLDTPYRPQGWTVRQVVHHCADSHMNALIRFKLTLTEEKPTIKPYNEKGFAELPDSVSMPLEPGLKIIDAVHERWVLLLKSLTEEDLQRKYIHPEYNKEFSLNEAAGLYAWHCNHHLTHITTLKNSDNWK